MQKENIADVYRLSPTQQGMLFHSLYSPTAGEYLLQYAYALGGEVDVPAFERAWRAVVERHPTLRTSFHWEGLENWVQVVRRQVELPIEHLDWRHLESAEQESRLEDYLRADRRRGFELDRAPLLRLMLARTGPDTYRFVWTFHHLILDGWSLPVVLGDLFRLYHSERHGLPSGLGPAPPYRAYIAWLKKQDPAATEAFWRRQLEGFRAPVELEFGSRGESTAEDLAPEGSAEHRLTSSATQRFEEFARTHQLTLNHLVQGAWGLLLGRMTGQRDLVFGTTVSGRPADLPGVESAAGLFINTLPVRLRLDPQQKALDFLRDLRQLFFELRSFEHSPLADLQRWSEVPQGSALFHYFLAYENFPHDAGIGVDGLEVRDTRVVESSHYPLSVAALPGEYLILRARYDDHKFEEHEIRRLLGHFAHLLDQLVTRPDEPLARLDLLSDRERHQVLVEWNDRRSAYPETTIHGLFEELAQTHPEKPALVGGDLELTFGELDQRANWLASSLRADGVQPEDRIGLEMPRSGELVVAMLGVLKAGAAYVPLAPDLPPKRRAFLIEDAGVSKVLGSGSEDAQGVSEIPSSAAVHANQLAYVLYTSGSTGRPKGVAISHRGVVRLAQSPRIAPRPGATALFQSSPAFDATTLEVWCALLNGCTLAVFPPQPPTPDRLMEIVTRHGVSHLHLTPGLFHRLVEDHLETLLGHTRNYETRLLVGGDLMSPHHARSYLQAAGRNGHRPTLTNCYGPTENTVLACAWPMARPDDLGPTVSLGRPLANVAVQVFDRSLRPMPPGVPGELGLSGDGLARGYFGRPARTAQSFVPHPTSSSPGDRLYLSGDRIRQGADGRLEFLGRIDHQVKVRGFRIEPGEIEKALLELPGIRQAVVVARQEGADDASRLVAYLVPDSSVEADLSPGPLRQGLGNRLPEYMFPAAFVVLDTLPLTSIGKIDRAALPAPDSARPDLGHDFVAARDEAEAALAKIWCHYLRLDRVGVHDNFFELGGDSILSLQIVSKAGREGLHLTPRQIFEHPTIAAQAALAQSSTRENRPEPLAGPVPLTPIQKAYFEEGPKNPHHHNQALLLRADDELRPHRLARALTLLTEHHDALRLRFEETEGSWQATCAESEQNPLLLTVDLSGLRPSERPRAERIAKAQGQTALRVDRGPLLRGLLLQGGSNDGQRLLLVIHHLAVDGVSWRLLLEDLEAAYDHLGRGLSSHETRTRLAPTSTPWRRWARRLSQATDEESLGLETGIWHDWASAETSPLAPEGTTSSNTAGTMGLVERTLDRDVTEALLQRIPGAAHARPQDLLLTALASALGPWCGGSRVWIDLESHGREEVLPDLDLSRTLGWFTTLFPILLDTSRGPLTELLRRVKFTLRSVPRNGFDYGIARYLSEDPTLAKIHPQVSFNYLGRLDTPSEGRLFHPTWEDAGPLVDSRERRSHLLDVVAAVVDERLRITWAHDPRTHPPGEVEDLADRLLEHLQEFVEIWSRAHAKPCLIAEDFPLAQLDEGALHILEDLGQAVEDVYPLAPLQEGLLFQTLLNPELDLYVEQMACELEGDLDPSLFRQAWQEAARHHTVLRTRFLWEDLPRPVQVVLREGDPSWTEDDLQHLAPEDRRDHFQRYIAADRAQGFDLADGPPIRLALFPTGNGRAFFLWTQHHLLMDGWSLSLVLRQVFDHYRRLRGGKVQVAAAGRPYRDYLTWLDAQDREATRTWWRETLAGFDAPTPLGVDRPAPDESAAASRGFREHHVPRGLSRNLERFGKRHRLTPSTLVQGAWALLLHRYGGASDVVFGSIVSGRPSDLQGSDAMVGLFINALPVRVRMERLSNPVVPWLEDLQRNQGELSQRAWTALKDVQAESEIPAGENLFQSLVVFENYPIDESLAQGQEGPGHLALREVRLLARTDQPLALVAMPGERLALRLNYQRQRFADTTIVRALGHLESLLRAMAEAPQRPLHSLSLLQAAERHQILVEWNEPLAYEIGPTVQHHFEAQVLRSPQAPAVVSEAGDLTFEELNVRSNRLAHRLRGLGVGPEICVGIALHRRPEMVEGILGILKAGGAYVPLDPEHPPERLASILGQTPVRALVTEEALLAHLPSLGAPCEILCLDRDRALLDEESPINPPAVAGPENLAYVMYTSGSTGKPKGVMIPHRGVVNRLVFGRAGGHVQAGDRFLQKASIGFDVSLLEIFLPLFAGGATVLARPGGHRDPEYLARWMVEKGVHQAIFPPSLLRLLLEEKILAEGPLHSVASSADALSVELQDDFFRRLSADLNNRYGPTETSIAAASWKCSPHEQVRTVPIGRPIAQARLLVLRGLEPTPIGAAGELVIGGPGLARGYFGRPGITAEKFVPDPWQTSERLYRTGDLVRLRHDGAIEFLGRVDHQLKIRGYRVEPGEIEAVLEEQEAVKEAVVVAREDEPGLVRLVAYLVPPDGAEPEVDVLRRTLQERLPTYMVPAALMVLDVMPLSANGKLDRKALPAPEFRTSGDLVAPRTSPEKMLAEVWAEVLGLSEVGADDNFFGLGGDSILSLRVISKAREAGFKITLKQLFEYPTLAELAEVVEVASGSETDQGPLEGTAPLHPIQRRFLDAEPVDPHHFNQAVLLQPTQALDPRRMAAALAAVIRHHDALRLRFDIEDGTWVQRYEPPQGPVPQHQLDLSALPEERLGLAQTQAMEAVQGSFDLEHGPILRGIAFQHSEPSPGRWLLVVHHLAIDGVSWRILLEDLESAYLQLESTARPRFGVKTTSYREATQHLDAASGHLTAEELAPWEISSPPPPLPLDFPRPQANTFASSHTVERHLGQDETEALLRELPNFYKCRTEDLLLSALAMAIQTWTGAGQVLVDLESHGREHGFEDLDLSRTVGWFTVLYPTLLDLGNDPDLSQRVRSIRDALRRIPRGGLPWALAHHGPQRRPRALPEASISFNYLGRLDLSATSLDLFAQAPEPVTGTRSPQAPRHHLIAVNAAVVGGRLELGWTHSWALHRLSTIELLAQGFENAVRSLIDHARQPAARDYRPTDFPHAKINQKMLDKILQQVTPK